MTGVNTLPFRRQIRHGVMGGRRRKVYHCDMLIECIPNVSEGRRPDVVAAIAAAIRAVPGVRLLDHSSDASHNRFGVHARRRRRRRRAGGARAVRARRRRHRSAHAQRRASAAGRRRRRPVRADRRRDDGRVRRAGEEGRRRRSATRFGVPVYLYEEASANPARKNLEDIRRGEFEGLAAKMATPGWAPDFGPAAPHPTAGAVGDRRAHAAHRLQHQPRHRPARRREEDRRRDPPQQRRLPVRQGDGLHARRPRHRPGVDEPDELREDADLPRVRDRQARGRALRRRRCWKAKSSGWSRRRR